MHPGPPIAPVVAAALTDAGLLLVLVASAVAIVVFVLFVLHEVLSRPAELPRELAPARELPPVGGREPADPGPAREAPPHADRKLADPGPAQERRPNPGADRAP
jgi:hypothetical protein